MKRLTPAIVCFLLAAAPVAGDRSSARDCSPVQVLTAIHATHADLAVPADVDAVEAGVEFLSGSEWLAVKPGDFLPAGSRLRLAEGARVALRPLPTSAGPLLAGPPPDIVIHQQAAAGPFDACEGSDSGHVRKGRINGVAVCAANAADAKNQAENKANVQGSQAATDASGAACAATLKCTLLDRCPPPQPQQPQTTCKVVVTDKDVTKAHEVANCVNTGQACTPPQQGKTVWTCDVKLDWKYSCECRCI